MKPAKFEHQRMASLDEAVKALGNAEEKHEFLVAVSRWGR